MSTTLVLALLYWNEVFMLEIEANENGIGVVLLQDKNSIAYLRKEFGMIYNNEKIYMRKGNILR